MMMDRPTITEAGKVKGITFTSRFFTSKVRRMRGPDAQTLPNHLKVRSFKQFESVLPFNGSFHMDLLVPCRFLFTGDPGHFDYR